MDTAKAAAHAEITVTPEDELTPEQKIVRLEHVVENLAAQLGDRDSAIRILHDRTVALTTQVSKHEELIVEHGGLAARMADAFARMAEAVKRHEEILQRAFATKQSSQGPTN